MSAARINSPRLHEILQYATFGSSNLDDDAFHMFCSRMMSILFLDFTVGLILPQNLFFYFLHKVFVDLIGDHVFVQEVFNDELFCLG